MSAARALVLLAALLAATPAAAEWTFAVTPYLWLPNINGTLKFDPPPASTSRPERLPREPPGCADGRGRGAQRKLGASRGPHLSRLWEAELRREVGERTGRAR